MNHEKTLYLKEKRKLLQQEIHKNELKKRIHFQIKYLEDNEFTYELNYNNEYLLWLQNNVPIRKKDGDNGEFFFQVDVKDTSNNCDAFYTDIYQERLSILNDELQKRVSQEDLIVICYGGGDPEIEISVKTLLSNIDRFIVGGHFWFIGKEKNLVIEYILSQGAIRFITP